MSKRIKVFTDGSPLSDDVVEQVKKLACSKCEFIVNNLSEPPVAAECEDKVKGYGITSLPAVTIDGKVVDYKKFKKK
ncbi:thioredoxin domain-containing protein [Paenibacillus macquariensis]|uniref:Glutaredoxin n=1 Tax=Paenibacillus macquariensis TaxID=948756 RepID=A0ABY1JU13_9BACL|nr:hypothetical protein [Paenibacillus macquariensis]MEC0091037.1 glutaredoxin [Paenibacillus macquariensis]OAB34753.1 hypothetical protein PMSM_12980 [Paenibacillus macquariensis subsp. macquariensis]SIQ78044.1 hypothetical protein SAMN05421578_10419 [Paenibacillus macquariensis]